MTYRFAVRATLLPVALASTLFSTSAQDMNVPPTPENGHARTEYLGLSQDGLLLREALEISTDGAVPPPFTRVVTYDVKTGKIRSTVDLSAETNWRSATSDGTIAVISTTQTNGEPPRQLFLFNTETGERQDIPSSWFDADDQYPFAAISGDGRLISAYTESNSPDVHAVVSVYDWHTKKLVAQQISGFPAGGFFTGYVTQDGKIAFIGNRGGGDVLDPATGRTLVEVPPNFSRSPDGAWVIAFPNTLYGDTPRKVIIKNGETGKEVGKLDIHIDSDEQLDSWAWARGTFCGTSGRYAVATNSTVQLFEIPSGKKIATFPKATWQDAHAPDTDGVAAVACSFDGKRVAIRTPTRLSVRKLK